MAADRIAPDDALDAMKPFVRTSVLLERIWPPSAAPAAATSQIGGSPNLPPDWEWPRIDFADSTSDPDILPFTASLDFLAQIRLSDLPAVEQRELLPGDGMLYFFALSQSHVPLYELGPEAARVLYYPGDASVFPQRPPPPDAGWNLGQFDYGRSLAADYRDPDESPGILIPRCPIRLVAAKSWSNPRLSGMEPIWRTAWNQWQGSAPPLAHFKHDDKSLPSHVEDAILQLNYARNRWHEGVATYEDFAGYYEHATPMETLEELRPAYDDWRRRAKAMSANLRSMGRAAALVDTQRSDVRALLEEGSRMHEAATGYTLWLDQEEAAILSLATLLPDHPEAVADRAAEIAAAHPGHVAARGNEGHRMLGNGYAVQQDIPKGSVLLLQLGSDRYGPRFMWGDAGNISFWIGEEDLAHRRFDRSQAEIYGH